ncbi:MAG: carbohydrate porin [Pseudomonadota bacterium]|nr:carbohydrate porin [Pseudomonadota bacterium]
MLGKYGIAFGLSETDEVLGNPTGGRARGAVYEGLTQASLGIDLAKAIGLSGGIFNVSMLQIHGGGLSVNNIDSLSFVSGIEADRSTRLFELWYQQSFLGGKVDVKIGQQSADEEFLLTQYGSLFINASFGWPTLPTVDLPSGGPAYPLATPAVRLRARPTDKTTFLIGVFNGSPAGFGPGDPQLRNASGTAFRVGDGAFVIGELQYAINQEDDAKGLPGTYKVGAWYNSNAFDDPFYAASGLDASGPPVNGARTHRGDWSIYAVVDQLVFRPAGAKDGGAGVFVRAMGAPGDRNEVSAFVDAGITYKGAFRHDDTMGLAFGWTRISGSARDGDALFNATSARPIPLRGSESFIEATYQAQVAPWWQVQPDVQYVLRPGGGILNPDGSGRKVGNALVLGVRTVVTF